MVIKNQFYLNVAFTSCSLIQDYSLNIQLNIYSSTIFLQLIFTHTVIKRKLHIPLCLKITKKSVNGQTHR